MEVTGAGGPRGDEKRSPRATFVRTERREEEEIEDEKADGVERREEGGKKMEETEGRKAGIYVD